MEDSRYRAFLVDAEGAGMRLDAYLASKIEDLSRNRIQKLNKEGFIKVDGASRPDHYCLKPGENVELAILPDEESGFELVPQDIPIKIVYEDDDIAVVNKDAGLVVHPAHGNWEGTLVNALLGRGMKLAELGSPFRPGIVHRLDKDTSGLIVVAKNNEAYENLARQIKQKRFLKVYHAISWGNIGERRFTVDAPIGRHRVHRQKMAVLEKGGREALTNFFIIDSFRHFDYIRITAYTGRTHQIRVHLAHIQHPILGDPVYGGRRRRGLDPSTGTKSTFDKALKMMKRHALHASKLAFDHPKVKRMIEFTTALPDDMRKVLELLYLEDWLKEART